MSLVWASARKIYLTQGEHVISDDPGAVISTLLGSCVAVCLWDQTARVGGMNHFLLPDVTVGGQPSSVGAFAMEGLINDLLKAGASRAGLRAKVFGGAAVVKGLSDIGSKNAAFAEKYLRLERIPCDAASTGGDQARQVHFAPVSGLVRQRFVRDASVDDGITARTTAPRPCNGVELF
jgi:chemotaxis protein CheD